MLIDEIGPWLMQFKHVGEYGKAVLAMMRAEQAGEKAKCSTMPDVDAKDCKMGCRKSPFVMAHAHAQALQNLMYQLDASYNHNRYQPGVKSCSKILLPTFQELFGVATERYNKVCGTDLNAVAVYMPYALESDVKQLALLPMRQKGNAGSVSPSNEVIIWQAGGSVTVTMDYARVLQRLVLNLGAEGAEKNFKLEVSADGLDWVAVPLVKARYKNQLQAEGLAGRKVLKLRLCNVSGAEQKVYFKQFEFGE